MTNKTWHDLFGYAVKEQAKRVVIAGSKNGLSFSCHLPGGEEAVFNLPKKFETDLVLSLKNLLNIIPGELSYNKHGKIKNKNYRLNFRLNIVPDKFGEKIVINVIDEEDKIISLNKLGFQKKELQLVKQKIKSKSGLIVITSKERQGKTITMQSLLKELNQENKNIYLLDSAPEFTIDGINCLDNKPENWEKILNHDSDIIAFEAQDDKEDIKKAIEVAGTGRLVIITIKANNSLEALYKLLTSGAPLKLTLNNLKLIIGQELTTLKRATTKNKGRKKIGLFEVFTFNKDILNFITKNKTILKTANFWKQFFQVVEENGYEPLVFDYQQKKRDKMI